MKFLKIIFNGGHPLRRADLRWVQDGFLDRISALLRAMKVNLPFESSTLPNSTAVIYGCTPTLISFTQVTWTEGVVMIDGQMYHLPASASPLALSNPVTERFYIEPDVSDFSPAGLKMYQSGIPYDTFEIKKAKVSVLTTPQPLLSLLQPVKFMAGIQNADEFSSNLSVTGSGWSVLETMTAKLTATNKVRLSGAIERTSVGAALIGTLNARFAPTITSVCLVPNLSLVAGSVPGVLSLLPSGQLIITSANPLVGDIYNFTSVELVK